ncbi:MAG: exopolysaccharide biosynthesis polyprenyl glycosylphosphotransferase [Acidobacteria bacterium]|nr:MAG: exopolysaccharide biosynthesis polyprenyl glycosylphosphotransferase [Acidobacteriota bacterium]
MNRRSLRAPSEAKTVPTAAPRRPGVRRPRSETLHLVPPAPRTSFPAASPAPADKRAVLIVGQGPAAVRCAHNVIWNAGRRWRLAGVVSPDKLRELIASGAPLPRRCVVALDDRRGTLPVDDLVALRFRGVEVQEAASFLEEITGKLPLSMIRPADLAFAPGFRLPRWKLRLKRICDQVLAFLLLIVTAPVLAAAAAAIWLESGAPVLFRQKRLGLYGRPFTMLKLRTMRQDAEKNGPQFSSADDDRVTRVGRFLRRTRIDELPQLWNVLRGEMSLVGPRPERPEFVEELDGLIPYFTLRTTVRPGITGWAQVNEGYASSLDTLREKLAYDLYYIKNFSFRLELLVLFRTVATVISGRGV